MDTGLFLVAGGSGFLGCHIVHQLFQFYPNCRVRVMDMRRSDDLPPQTEFLQGDITKEEDVARACEGVHTVFNTVSPVHGGAASIYEKVNVQGNHCLIDAAIKARVHAYVYTSTASVVFCGQDVRGADETLEYCKKHIDPYNYSKERAEREVLRRNGEGGLQTVALRPSGIFGPGDRQAWPGFIEAAESGKSKYILGSGKNKMDWTYVGNLAYAHVEVARHLDQTRGVQEERHKVDGEAFFITNGEPIPFYEMATYCWKNMGYPVPRIHVPKWLIWYLSMIMDLFVLLLSPIVQLHPTITFFRIANVVSDRYFSIEKARSRFGYNPPISLADGMERTLDYFKRKRDGEKIDFAEFAKLNPSKK